MSGGLKFFLVALDPGKLRDGKQADRLETHAFGVEMRTRPVGEGPRWIFLIFFLTTTAKSPNEIVVGISIPGVA
jgi:hypothetical protein